MKKLTLISVLAVLLPILSGAQTNSPKNYLVGDVVENITLRNVINYPDSIIQLKDLKGRYIVLAFWSPYCKPCVRSFPELDSLQNEYAGQIQFVLVTHRFCEAFGPDSVASMLKKIATKTSLSTSLPVTTSDNEDLFTLFNHSYVPFYVWISPTGRIAAFTDHQLMNKKTVIGIVDHE